MKHTLYPKVLVSIQFGLMASIVYFSTGFLSHTYALPIFVMGMSICDDNI